MFMGLLQIRLYNVVHVYMLTHSTVSGSPHIVTFLSPFTSVPSTYTYRQYVNNKEDAFPT